MSMITITAGSDFSAPRIRETGFFARLAAAIRLGQALESNSRPAARDLETLGIANSFNAYLRDRDAAVE